MPVRVRRHVARPYRSVALARPRTPALPVVPAFLAGLALTAALVTSPLAAQPSRAPAGPPNDRVSAGVALNLMQPRGEFGDDTGLGGGIGGNVLFRVDEHAILNLRADVSFMVNGNVRRRVPLSSTVGNLIKVDLNTSNSVMSFLVGPQLLGPGGAFVPYASALAGFSAFVTSSSIEGSNNVEPFASTTNSSDFAWAYGGAAGTYWRLKGGDRPIHLDLGVRYLRHDDVTYLTAREVRASIEANREPRPLRSRADFLTYMVGVQARVF
jgi:hypothetical protein